MWATDAELMALVAAVHGYASPASAPPHWSPIVARANRSAFNRLRGIMRAKGYFLASLARWADRVDYNLQGGVCNALTLIGLPAGQEGSSLATYCKVWEEIEKLGDIYDEDGELIPPDELRGSIGFGPVDTSGDTFTRDTVL